MIFCVLFLLFNLSIEDKIISIYYNKFRMERPLIPLSFIDEKCTATTFPNTYINYTVFDDNLKNPLPKHFQNKTIERSFNRRYIFSLYNTDIMLNETILKNMNILVHEDDHIGLYADKGIGLKFKFEDERYSIVHMLYHNKLIDRKVFAFESYANKGYLHLGGIPNNSHLLCKYKGYINIEKNADNWKGSFNGIMYNNTKYNISSEFIIHSGHYGFIYSNELFNIFTKTIVKSFINDKVCWIVRSDSDGDSVECFPNYIEKMEDVSFIFNNMKISIPFSSLFIESNIDEVESLIRSFPSTMNYNSTVLGIMFIKSFNFSIFDYENNRISFYSDNIQIEMLKDNYIYTCFVIISILCLLNICILIIINLKQ